MAHSSGAESRDRDAVDPGVVPDEAHVPGAHRSRGIHSAAVFVRRVPVKHLFFFLLSLSLSLSLSLVCVCVCSTALLLFFLPGRKYTTPVSDGVLERELGARAVNLRGAFVCQQTESRDSLLTPRAFRRETPGGLAAPPSPEAKFPSRSAFRISSAPSLHTAPPWTEAVLYESTQPRSESDPPRSTYTAPPYDADPFVSVVRSTVNHAPARTRSSRVTPALRVFGHLERPPTHTGGVRVGG